MRDRSPRGNRCLPGCLRLLARVDIVVRPPRPELTASEEREEPSPVLDGYLIERHRCEFVGDDGPGVAFKVDDACFELLVWRPLPEPPTAPWNIANP